MSLPSAKDHLFPQKVQAFSLVEILAVMAIIIIMMGLLGPAINTMTSTAGRKGAVNILMNTLEQARAAALENGTNVYVILWQREFPDQDCLMVGRDPVEWNPNDVGKTFVPLTRWIRFPKGVLLYSGKGKTVFNSAAPADFHGNLSDLKVGGAIPKSSELGFVEFAPTGTVQHPSNAYDYPFIVSEGVRGIGGSEAVLADKKQLNGGFEIIRLRHFTGRASLDVSTL